MDQNKTAACDQAVGLQLAALGYPLSAIRYPLSAFSFGLSAIGNPQLPGYRPRKKPKPDG